ncbi:hypothetical protein P0W64_04385 [Tsukamurella sp. 8F]|uniref:hypothetical protein n=1 Tax=unclassified Tsukamurella TaxID=2633480 RepID=UPI0023B97705|nr:MULTISPECIES: hypothetical protein [unclassified Tsukamurella]MDF0529726.1 hypothetical protein [Tsukamurella sp. 8J]MDF0586011.1 hypothetical protein [Tsukamurella sp. 8F]
MPKPTTITAIFDQSDLERIITASSTADDISEDELMNFPARAWGERLELLGLFDLAVRARAELAETADAGGRNASHVTE